MKFYAPIKLSESIRETPEGFLLCLGVPIARTGVQIYGPNETPLKPGPDGKVKIYRDEKEVFRPETIASFQGKAFTLSHPDDFVTPENWSDLAKGVLQNVRQGSGEDKENLLSDILVTDAIAIGMIKRGVREVSCGYEAEYVQTAEGEGEQKNIVGNHLALVDQGRAGPAYAINDHRGDIRETPMLKKKKFSEKVKSLFAKAADEAAKAIEDEMPDDEKKDGASDADMPEGGGDMPAMDELMKKVSDLSDMVSKLMPKDEKKVPEDKKADDAESKADGDQPAKEEGASDEEVSPSIEDRLKALEMAVQKMLEGQSSDGDDDDSETMVGDEGDDEEAESKDAAGCYTGDTAARAEILAPGIKITKDVKAKALKAAYATEDGKAVINGLTAGKPTFDSAEKVDVLFIAASEVLKTKRSSALAKTKATRDFDSSSRPAVMTPERMNEINAAKYAQK